MGKKYIRKPVKIEENYDPLNVLPQEILDMIFGYLSVKDILKSSLVSWNWYNIIGKSECIKSINLVYNYGHGETDYMKSLLKSKRQYQNILVHYPFKAEIRLTVEKEVKKILQMFAGSIKFIDTPIDIHRCCELPKLRKLSCSTFDCRSFYTNGLFSRMEQIQALKILHRRWDEKFIKLYKDMLTSAKNLRVLNISPFFFSFLKECNLVTLREFRYERLAYYRKEQQNYDEVMEFLKMQNTLEVLHINSDSDDAVDDLLSVILAMPNLNKMHLSVCSSNITIREYLPINRTIQYLQLWGPNIYDILAFLENLQVLKVHNLNAMLLMHISSSPSIRKIIYKNLCKQIPADFSTFAQYSNIQFIKI